MKRLIATPRIRLHALGVLVLALLVLVPAAVAQQTTGIRGQIRDEAGAEIPGARVVAIEQATGRRYESIAGADGTYYLLSLPAGAYTIQARAVGYRTGERAVIGPGAAETATVDLVLVASPVILDPLQAVGVTRGTVPLAAIPGAVSVVTREEIQRQVGPTSDLGQILGKLVPGLSAGIESPSIYGQSLRGRNFAVLIDGVPQSTTRNVSRDLNTISAEVVERVEVLRGATSVYGDGATGGIVNIITRKPQSGEPRFLTEAGLSSSLSSAGDGTGGRVRQEISGVNGAVDYLLSASVDRTGGFSDAAGDLIPPDPHGQGGLADTDALNLLGKAGTGWGVQRLQLTINHFQAEQDTRFTSDPAVNALPAGTRKATALPGLRMDDDQGTRNTLASLDYRNDEVFGSRLHAQLYARDYQARFSPFDGRRFASLGNSIIQSRLESEKVGSRLEIETVLPLRNAPTLVWGADLSAERTSQPVGVIDSTAFEASGGLAFRTVDGRAWVPTMQPRSLGLFAQGEWRPAQPWLLRGGIRHERVGMQIDDFTTLAGNTIRGGALDYNATLFNLGTVVYPTAGVSAFINFSQGFSLADIGLFLRSAPAEFQIAPQTLEAQRVDSYEAGLRAASSRVQGSLVGFRNSSDLGTTSAGFDLTVVRAPERVYGMEATLDAQLFARWQTGGTLTWAEGEFAPDSTGFRPLNGYRIQPLKLTAYLEHQTLPRWSNRLQLLHSGDRDRAFRAFLARPGVNPERPGFGERPVESFTLLDYTGTIDLGPGTLRIGIENLLNTAYFNTVSQLMRTGGNSSYAAGRGTVLSLGFTLRY